MAKSSGSLIVAMRQTADRLDSGCHYQWTHQGACNCGHLVQTVTSHTPAEIHALALEKQGDWAQKAIDYCPQSRYPIDHMIGTLLSLGLTRQDIIHLERLSDPHIVRQWPTKEGPVRNRRTDVVQYLRLWADHLEARLPAESQSKPQAKQSAQDTSHSVREWVLNQVTATPSGV